ncbi:MAG: hypothetical protein V4687_06485 [Bacteroidota bacterium]
MKAENILTVARYLEGDMELEEKLAFENRMREDELLSKDVEEYKQIHHLLKINVAPDDHDKQVAMTLNVMNKQYFKEQHTGNANLRPKAKVITITTYLKYISIAAVLVIGLLVWAPWSENLYKQYRISTTMSVLERGSNGRSRISEGAALYNKGDFKEAKRILQNEYMLYPQNPLLAYYFSIILIENDKAPEARTILLNLYQGESVFKFDAAYYIALSYVKEENQAEAIQWLKKIPGTNANYKKAIELIGKLK